ncbi:metalloregulator ArsR/SmtB family transcription factor [Clostridium sp. CS001]|uniref:ArsR/SmtB family transcription factor n=1 Tax=Clostridium sp. CS001 TaxID=2880648 RepID=UPI001CF5260F|nr:metalloregulator ArsR/SmtB family transcription factor [Clostridium sp. CS001]MCB2290031.1 metalloregulator ArsR/SmtB family transcription factor [Clostridium sp. CS001]
MELVEVLKVLGDENRIRILNLLRDGELCVCEIESILELNQSNVSRHLTRLSSVKLIKSYKKAQFIYYTINDETISNYEFIREILTSEVNKIEECTHDTKMLSLFKECNINCENIECGKSILDSELCKCKKPKV